MPAHVRNPYLWAFFLGQSLYTRLPRRRLPPVHLARSLSDLLRKKHLTVFDVCLPVSKCCTFFSLACLFFFFFAFATATFFPASLQQIRLRTNNSESFEFSCSCTCISHCFIVETVVDACFLFSFLHRNWWNFALVEENKKKHKKNVHTTLDSFLVQLVIVTVSQKSAICKFSLLEFDMQLNCKQTIHNSNRFLCKRQFRYKFPQMQSWCIDGSTSRAATNTHTQTPM